jgi:hypothetical protein
MTVIYTGFYISLKLLCSLNYQDITGKIYPAHRSDLLRHSKPLSEDKALAWKVLSSNRWNLNLPFQYEWEIRERVMQIGCFKNKNNHNNNTKTTAKTTSMGRHLHISGDKSKTNVHDETHCPLIALTFRYEHYDH